MTAPSSELHRLATSPGDSGGAAYGNQEQTVIIACSLLPFRLRLSRPSLSPLLHLVLTTESAAAADGTEIFWQSGGAAGEQSDSVVATHVVGHELPEENVRFRSILATSTLPSDIRSCNGAKNKTVQSL